jgi:hypothetical protein
VKKVLTISLIAIFLFSARLFAQMDNPSVRSDKTPYLPKYNLWTERPTSTPEPTMTPNPYVWYDLEPKVVKLTGRVINVKAYGPPDYEGTDESKKIDYKILKLEQPINVKGDPESGFNEDVLEVKTLEMDTNIDLNPLLNHYLGKRVEVEGTLERPQQGGSLTEVVLDLQKISLKK